MDLIPEHSLLEQYECTLKGHNLHRAEIELGETEERRWQAIGDLREMVMNAGDIKCPTDAAFLLRFLRAKKFDVIRAYTCLRRFYEVRHQHPDIFSDFHPHNMRHVFDEHLVTVLQKRDSKGRSVILIKPGQWHPDVVPLQVFMRSILISLEWLLRDEVFQVNGLVLFVDFANVGMKQARQLSRERIKLLMFLVQEAFPVRLKAIHIMNAPALLQYFLKIISLFLKDKVKERITVHGFRLYGLFNDLGEDVIPEQYGGRLIMEPEWWRNQLVNHEADLYFKQHMNDGLTNIESHDETPIITIDSTKMNESIDLLQDDNVSL